MKRAMLLLVAIGFATGSAVAQKEPKKTGVEQQEKICEGLPQVDKPVVAIMPFKIGVADAGVGTGLSDMLMNAVFGCGCFRVVERERLNDIMKEQGLGLSGAGDEASFAQVGKLSGANVLVFGTITEFKENESGSAGGSIFRLPGGIGGVGVGKRTSHLGYTLRFINPNTAEVLDMKSFDKKRTAVGLAGGGIWGRGGGAGAFYKSKSMQDALEESLIEAVTYMSQNKSVYAGIVTDGRAAVASAAPQMVRENCALVKLPRKPKFMVIIPEEHLAGKGSNYDDKRIDLNVNPQSNEKQSDGTYNGGGGVGGDNNSMQNGGQNGMNTGRNFFRPPDPAGETEIAKRFLEYGFELIDSKLYEKLRTDKDFLDALDNTSAAQRIGQKFGADILIVGEAFSEYSKSQNGMSSCRARVEVKAIMTKNAQLLATDGLYGSGMDISEVIAGKKALTQAGGKIADYFLAQLCPRADDISAQLSATGSGTGGGIAGNTSELRFKNVDFNKAMAINNMLKAVKGVTASERTSFQNNVAAFKVTHTGDTNSLLEKIATVKSLLKLNILSTSGNVADIEVMN